MQGPMIFVVALCRTRVIFLFKKYFCADACCLSCCRGHKDWIEVPATELATIDTMKEKLEREAAQETEGQSLLDKLADATPTTRSDPTKTYYWTTGHLVDKSKHISMLQMQISRYLLEITLIMYGLAFVDIFK